MFNKPILPSFFGASKAHDNPEENVPEDSLKIEKKTVPEANLATSPAPGLQNPEQSKEASPVSPTGTGAVQPQGPATLPPSTNGFATKTPVPPRAYHPDMPKETSAAPVQSKVNPSLGTTQPQAQPAPIQQSAPQVVQPKSNPVVQPGKPKSEPIFSNQPDEPVGADGIVRGPNLHDTRFSDIWFTPENIAYVRDMRTHFALTPIETPDLEDFHKALEQGYQGSSSYAVRFAGDSYRVERVMTNDGVQYNCRKMPTSTPEIETLGFAEPVVKHLTSLVRSAGLLLFAGPTGQGKTTSASAIMKRFLDTEGGFLFTIEDPPEMPLGGLYHAKNGGLGLCKQTPVENDQWGACLRSALRSKPRYILVGEIRTPETASQCLVAATSGHLVLSTIHANGVEDALNSMIKYASSSGLDESLVSDLLARGILGVIYQRLEGVGKLKLHYETAFANPNTAAADQMRMSIRDGSINLATFMETQKTRMSRGLPMFKDQ